MRQAAMGVKLGILHSEDITQELLEMCLYTGPANSVDLIVRYNILNQVSHSFG